LPPEKAFGPRNPDLIQRVSAQTLKENSAFGEQYVIGDLVDFLHRPAVVSPVFCVRWMTTVICLTLTIRWPARP
jgi:hypothetical protein